MPSEMPCAGRDTLSHRTRRSLVMPCGKPSRPSGSEGMLPALIWGPNDPDSHRSRNSLCRGRSEPPPHRQYRWGLLR